MTQKSDSGIALLLVLLLIGVLFIVPMLGMFMWAPMGGRMMGGWGAPYGYGWRFMSVGMIVPLIFIGLLIIGAYVLLKPRVEPAESENALRILNERYAKGEITGEQYSEMKKNLSNK